MEARVYSASGDEMGTTNLPEDVFGGPIRRHLLYEVVRGYLANRRQGTSKVKSRGEIRGGGRKPWRQKGTGRARQGTIRSPLWVGGGRAHGPKPRSYAVHLNKKMRRQALRSALTAKAQGDHLAILEDVSFPEPRTRHAYALLKKMGVERSRCLLVLDGHDPAVLRATRNLRALRVTSWEWLNCHDVLDSDRVLLTKGALSKLAEARMR